jgi:hypothetical protein
MALLSGFRAWKKGIYRLIRYPKKARQIKKIGGLVL